MTDLSWKKAVFMLKLNPVQRYIEKWKFYVEIVAINSMCDWGVNPEAFGHIYWECEKYKVDTEILHKNW